MRPFLTLLTGDRLIGNQAPGQFIIWSIVSIIILMLELVYFVCLLTQEETDEVQPVLLVLLCEFPSQK